MRSIAYIREEKLFDALKLLESSYSNQVIKLKNEKAHPFLEQSINQLGLLYKATRQYDKAEEMYGNQVKIKENYYGEESESLISALKNLATT
jgi:tetratricopeptide (TPR) repeat protein